MVLGITLVAAMLLGAGFVLQQHAAEQEPQAYYMRLRLILDLLRRRRWLLGFGIMISGQLLSAWCVGHLALTLYEPLLATSLIFALALAVPISHQRLRATELIGAVILSCGVAALSLSREPGTPHVSFGSFADWPAAAGIAAIAYCCIHAGHRRSGPTRATLTGVGAGLVFGISDALTRRTVQILDAHSFHGLLTSWPPYCLVAAALIANWLMQNAFNAAPLHSSLPAITASEPLAGILLGIVVFGDTIDISVGMLAVQAAGIAALVVGVIMVARAPVLSHLRVGPARPGHPDPDGPPDAGPNRGGSAAAGGTVTAPGGTGTTPGRDPATPGGTPATPGGTPAMPGGTPAASNGVPAAPGAAPAAANGTAVSPGGVPVAPLDEVPAPPNGTPTRPAVPVAPSGPAPAESMSPRRPAASGPHSLPAH
jgi:drug/metabolite transporter (DMT)-like permease